MRKAQRALTVAIVAAGAVAVAPAMAQEHPDTDIEVDVKATPSKAGTPGNPRGMKLSGTARIKSEPGFEPPIVTGGDLLIGKGIDYNGDDYVRCAKRTLDREGPKGCPRKSIMGAATASARADTIVTHPDVVFVNGGSKRLFAYTTLYNPAFVQETIVLKSTELKGGGKWHYRDTFRVPERLQVVAGVPIQLTGIDFAFGGKPYARGLMTTTSCPRGGWKYAAKIYYLYNDGQTSEDTVEGSIPCTK